MYARFREHCVVFELRFSERRAVSRNDDEFGFAGSERLES